MVRYDGYITRTNIIYYNEYYFQDINNSKLKLHERHLNALIKEIEIQKRKVRSTYENKGRFTWNECCAYFIMTIICQA